MRLTIVALLGLAATVQAQGTVRGHVRSIRTGEGIAGATVLIVGTRTGAIADSAGAYVVTGVTAGDIRVRARFIGYTDTEQAVTVRDGETSTVEFRLTEAITTL